MRTIVMLSVVSLAVCLSPGCNSRTTGSGTPASLEKVGGVVSDPARECVFVSDADKGIIYELDLGTGEVLREFKFGNPVGGLATDECGDILYVCQSRFPVISLVDLERLQIRDHLPLPAHARRVQTNGDMVYATTRLGLVASDLRTNKVRVIAGDLEEDALMTLSRDGAFLFTAERLEGQVRVRRFPTTGMVGFDQEQQLPPVTPVQLQVSHDDCLVFLGCQETGELMVLHSKDLSLKQCVDLGPNVRSVAINAISTRAYSVGDGLSIQERNMANFRQGHGQAMQASVSQAEGLFLAEDGQSMLSHHGGMPVRQGLFDVSLSGAPTAFMGDLWTLRVKGPPGAAAAIFWALDPGFVFLDPPNSAQARFLDLDPTALRVLKIVFLDQAGEWIRSFRMPPGSPPVDEVLLQAIALDRGALDVTNARPVRLYDPSECRR